MVDIAASTVVSQAFRLLEMAPVSSFADGSEEAVGVAQEYPVARDGLLARHDWSFASTLATPALIAPGAVTADPDLPHAHALPTALVMIRQVWPVDAIWRIDADALRSDSTGLRLRFTARIEDETRLGALFRTALSYTLAARLAPRWTTSANRAQILGQQAEDAFEVAMRADRLTASGSRWDGQRRASDWVTVAIR